MKIKIGTRGSKLALWQSNFIAAEIVKNNPNIEVELVKVQTQGDKILDAPLAKIGGKGLFTKELELQLLSGKIDIAVHSLKDVPTELDEKFKIAVIARRENPFDAFVSNKFSNFDELPQGAIVGTSSLRRAAQILILRPDLTIKNLRGNVDTRLKKLDAGEFDAVILAAAGLKRLGYDSRINQTLTQIIPAAGQGAIAVEIRADDSKTFDAIKFLNDYETCAEVKVERDFLQVVGGGCQIPVGIFAEVDGDKIFARAVIASLDGKNFVKDTAVDTIENLDNFGKNFAEKLLANGGREILGIMT
ncbi:MAG: hydroxymethylbilane synthase [Selenomonadaceae bacterium]|nr:hydroxymethylbilane synthase [Selenomonadaceae bacterium]